MKEILNSIYTDGSCYFVSNPNPKKGETIRIKIRVLENKIIENILFRTRLNGEEVIIPMIKENKQNNDYVEYYYVDIKTYEDILQYQFYICADKLYFYNQRGIFEYLPNETYDFKIITDYLQPSWVKEGVFYQIFPERFCNGNKDNDVKDNEYYFDNHPAKKIKNWNEPPKRYNEAFCLDFYGGDLNGITKKIPYLKELGITALYINPIFYAATIHKYDCLDYFTVDPHFGGDEALAELTKVAHENNIKVIIDVSINHTGTANKWFNKEGIFFDKSIGAYNNIDAKERKYYYFNDETNEYRSWLGVETLPSLNYTSEELKKVIYKDDYSLVKKWLKAPYNIDGWRFDVAHTTMRNDLIQPHHEIWPEIRKAIKETNPNAYILAEDWWDSDKFLQGNEWDSPMNYFGFARPVRDFLGDGDFNIQRHKELKAYTSKGNAYILANRILEHFSKLSFQIQENQFNLLDSHDVARLHNNKDVPYDHYKGAIITMFSMIGSPNVYYGDEVEIDGFTDEMEGCRYPFPWDKDYKNTKHFPLYQKLCQLKTTEKALKYGGLKILSHEKSTLVFARTTLDETIITVFNLTNEDQEIIINPKMFNITPKEINKDLLGTKLNTKLDNDKLLVSIESNKSYIFKL